MNCAISIGSNIEPRSLHLMNAVGKLHKLFKGRLISSETYESKSWGFEGEDFLNMCVLIQTRMQPHEILPEIQKIEDEMGRVRTEEWTGYEDRIIDIDILIYENIISDEKELRLPHPRMHKRKFVLAPLAEIAGDWIHPTLNEPIKKLNEICKDPNPATKYEEL